MSTIIPQPNIAFNYLLIARAGASTAAADHQHHSAEREYCQWDVFDASCDGGPGGDHRAVLMRTARYGLMKVGRCVAKNYGFVGCSTDVLGHMDSLCSGRRRCRFTVPDETMRAMLPCPKEFAPYLAASYQCVTGEEHAYTGHRCCVWTAEDPDGTSSIAQSAFSLSRYSDHVVYSFEFNSVLRSIIVTRIVIGRRRVT